MEKETIKMYAEKISTDGNLPYRCYSCHTKSDEVQLKRVILGDINQSPITFILCDECSAHVGEFLSKSVARL